MLSEELAEELAPEAQQEIVFGRSELALEVLGAAQARTSDLGVEILDFRFKRLNYVEEVRREVYNRMNSERVRIAERFRSEGAGESARINGERDRELKKISSEAYREAEEIKGRADAEAADIYARAYNRDPEFYRFTKSMEVLKNTMTEGHASAPRHRRRIAALPGVRQIARPKMESVPISHERIVGGC